MKLGNLLGFALLTIGVLFVAKWGLNRFGYGQYADKF